jgi:hypothetical protein
LKAAKEKLQLSYKGKAISRNPKSEKSMEWYISNSGSKCQPRLLYSAKLSFKISGEIKNQEDINNLNWYLTSNEILSSN